MKRGDIALVAGGVYARKPRPALIIQADVFEGTESVTVCPFTTTMVDAPLLRFQVTAEDDNGLTEDSSLMVDKLTTVRRQNLREVIGRLSPHQIVEVERRLMVFLGLAD